MSPYQWSMVGGMIVLVLLYAYGVWHIAHRPPPTFTYLVSTSEGYIQ